MSTKQLKACKICRTEAQKLFLKGERCNTAKCAFIKRKYRPGMHGQKRQKISGYSTRLREKQKLKRIYNILEQQFRKIFQKATKLKGETGDNLLRLLEFRLDNVIYRLGLGVSRAQARQLVNHVYFLVNKKSVNMPSYILKIDDEITIKKSKLKSLQEAVKILDKKEIPSWLLWDKKGSFAKVAGEPNIDQLKQTIDTKLIVEFYS